MTRNFPDSIHAILPALLVWAVFGLSGAQAQTPTEAQQSAIRSACPADYKSHCAGIPPGGKAALACLQQSAAKLSDACRTAVQAVGGSAATTPAPAAPAASAAPADSKPAGQSSTTTAPGKTTPGKTTVAPAAKAAAPEATPAPGALTPRQELALVRQSCAKDFRSHCRGVPIGGGNVVACLKENAASLSPRCQKALAPLAQ
ncbi:hypothetical protein K32_04290 [Kaistia sp. 32K]|uniref:cysteine rich repeat-containing protein n=1 Tax=Kaistia sp. 32K TaxID=2795690 RepID=UPI00191600A0|nr:cysteine rich repeat-containing protein [Kaistia sp. 32K]BCP51812.1 hypothetical protein K32_04290 [Kaistia sp. 32K]